MDHSSLDPTRWLVGLFLGLSCVGVGSAAGAVEFPAVTCSRSLSVARMVDQQLLLTDVSPNLPAADCATQINALQILRVEAGQHGLMFTPQIHWETVHLDQIFDPENYGLGKSLDQLHLLGESMGGGLIVDAHLKRIDAIHDGSLRPGLDTVRQFVLSDFTEERDSIRIVMGEMRDRDHHRTARKSLLLVGRDGPQLVFLDPTEPDRQFTRMVLVDSQRRGGQNFLRFGQVGPHVQEETFFWPLAITRIQLKAAGDKRHFMIRRPPIFQRSVSLVEFAAEYRANNMDFVIRQDSQEHFHLRTKGLGSSELQLISAIEDARSLSVIFRTMTEPVRVFQNTHNPPDVRFERYLGFYFPHGKFKGTVEEFLAEPSTRIMYGWPGWQNFNRKIADVTEFSFRTN